MKRNIKRLLALLLATLLCLSLLPGTALALEISGEDWEFDLTDMSNPTLLIKSDKGMTDWIEKGSSYRSIVFSVELSEGITKIPYHAFWKCTNLTTVEIPASVTEMGKNDVFEGCTALTSITVADGNENFFVEGGVLYGYAKDGDGNKINNKFVALICPPGKSGSVTLKDGTVEIGGSAFEGCTQLTGVTLKEGLTRIGSNAFGGCSGLQNVTLPASLTSLGNGVFDGCAGLTSLAVAGENEDYSAEGGVLYDKNKTELLLYPAAKSEENFIVPDSVTSIANNAFKGARYLKNVTAGALTSIESSAFMNCEVLISFTAASLSKVEGSAFYECINLETFTLTDDDSLTTIEGNAFNRCHSLTGAPLAGATSIGERAFQDCTALTSLSFHETGSVSIGVSAFSDCTGLTELTFPESVTSIRDKAFGGCNKVTVITFESASPPTCGNEIFSIGDPNEFQIVVPSGSESNYQSMLGETLGSYVGNTLVKKYPLFVNGQQLTSENTTITCGNGTAAFDVSTSTLTLFNATIDTMGGNYSYGGAINSGLAELTIKLVGTNIIHAHAEQWGTIYQDSINSGTNCDVKIVSGEEDGTTPTLICDLIDMGRGDSGFTGGAGEGNLTVDGVNLTVNDRIFVHHNATFQNGAQVNVTGGLTVNNSATVTVTGETTAITVKYIALGNDLPGQTNQLVLDSGTLTITGSVAYPGALDGDTNPYAIRFDPVSSGSIAINGGMFVKQASCAGTNIDASQITQANNLPVQGNWESGTLIIGPEGDGKLLVTVKSDLTFGGVAYGGGRYEPNSSVTLTATAQTGWFFIGWYQDGGETAVSVSKSYQYTVDDLNVTFTAKFIEDKLYQAEQAKNEFDEARQGDKLTWTILTDAVDAYEAVPAFLMEVKGINNLLTDEEKNVLDSRYSSLTTYYESVTALNLSNLDISNSDLAELSLFTGVTELNLSGNKGVTSLTGLSHMTKLETLDLSNTAITDLSSLNGLDRLTKLENLNLSGNRGITDLGGLKDLVWLETLDISNTGVTTLDALVKDTGYLEHSILYTLTAKDLSLTSLSALAELKENEMYWYNVISWNFDGSTLPDTEKNKADVETIMAKLGDKFIPPTIKTTPTGGGGGGGVITYGITVTETEHGKVTVSPEKAASGSTVTVTATPDNGYELLSLTVTDGNGNELELTDQNSGKYTFTMPASKVEIKAVFRETATEISNPFIDVYESDYYYDTVLWAVDNGITSGVSADLFAPNDSCTRAQIVAFLWRAYGSPRVTGSNPFTDVSPDDYYYDAVLWAVKNGVTAGTTDTTFSPGDTCTRAQAVTFQWRAAGSPAATGGIFNDVAADAYYIDAVAWAVANNITVGTGAGNFSPDDICTRAQIVTFLYRELA